MTLTWYQFKGKSLHLAKGLLELTHRSIKNLLPLVNHKNPITKLLNITQIMSSQENGCLFLLIDLGNGPTNVVLDRHIQTSKEAAISARIR